MLPLPVCEPSTPGVNATAPAKFPCEIGRLSIDLVSIAYDRSPLCVCSNACSADTVTVSLVPPTCSVIGGTPTRSPPVTRMPFSNSVLKAGAVTSREYVSALMFGIVKSPLALVCTPGLLVFWVSLMRTT